MYFCCYFLYGGWGYVAFIKLMFDLKRVCDLFVAAFKFNNGSQSC